MWSIGINFLLEFCLLSVLVVLQQIKVSLKSLFVEVYFVVAIKTILLWSFHDEVFLFWQIVLFALVIEGEVVLLAVFGAFSFDELSRYVSPVSKSALHNPLEQE